MKKTIILILSILSFSMTSFAHAQDSDGYGVGLKVGSTGASVEVNKAMTDTLNLRINYNDLSYDTDVNDTNVSYNADFSKTSAGVMVDWHPWNNGFRFSGGLYSHFDNDIDILATATSSATLTFNNVVYDANNIGSVTGQVEFGSTTPYLGIGWGTNPQAGSGWGFIAELGVQFQDTPLVNVTANNCTLPGTLCTQLGTDLEAERVELVSDLEDFDLWPVLNIGVSYKF